MMKEKLVLESYNLINDTANSNVALQGLSGLIGFPATILVDGAAVFTHYSPMINKIRLMYCKEPLTKEQLTTIVKSISNEIIFDIVVDKIAGQIPIAGIYFNAICAKAFTWRLGILFSMISSLDGDINDIEALQDVMILIRNMFPQKDIFKFTRPDYKVYKKIMDSAYEGVPEEFINRVDEALKAFEI